jgi:hypothetical protein
MNKTPFENQCKILGEVWINYRDNEEFRDFVEYNDLGLPLAYLVSTNFATATKTGLAMISETWFLLLESLEVEDTGFDSFEGLLVK